MMRRIAVLALTVLPLAFAAGCGGGGTPATQVSGGSGTVGFTASSLTFASTPVGASAGVQTLTFSNPTSAAITITGITASTNNPSFPETNTCGTVPVTLAAGASCTFSVNFTPLATGALTGSIAVVDNATNSPQTATLSGTGAPDLGVADLEPQLGLTFGTTVVASTAATQSANLTNTGTGPLTISSVLISGTNAGDFAETNTCGTSLAAAASCTITVSFTPAATGARAATLTVTDNSTTGTTQIIPLAGTAVATASPAVSLSATSLTFTSGTPQIVTVTNTGGSVVTLSGVTITGANASVFADNSTACGTSIAVGGACNISVTFVPAGASGTFAATLNIADNVTGSPQTVSLSGTTAPVATFSPTSLTLTEGTLSTTSASSPITLTNSGTATMTGIAVTITGASSSNFGQTNTCGSTLTSGSSCTINVTFTPTASGSVSANVSVADSAAGSPQTVALTGNGPGSTVLVQTLVTEFSGGFSSVYNLIDQATSTIEMTMYEDTDTTATTHFISAANRGVKVRIILDTNGEYSNNTTAYNALNGATITGGGSISVVWADTIFADTHEKSMIIDSAIPSKAQAGIFTANLSSQYYATSRDFLLYENDPNDIAAMETTFNSDFTNGTACARAKGCTYSPSGYTPPTGDDLVWSPTNATSALLAVIQSAKHTLTIDEEEMESSTMSAALVTAANNGVVVKVAITTSEGTASLLTEMKAAGITIAEYPGTGTELYIHAKIILADVGYSNENAFLGSENFSSNSLNNNRELGLVFNDSTSTTSQSIITSLNTTLQADVACQSDSHCTFY